MMINENSLTRHLRFYVEGESQAEMLAFAFDADHEQQKLCNDFLLLRKLNVYDAT